VIWDIVNLVWHIHTSNKEDQNGISLDDQRHPLKQLAAFTQAFADL